MTISYSSLAPLIVVVGATGLQGGSVINNLAASTKPYRVRGLTRDAAQEKAQALVERGAEVVSCNLAVGNSAEIEKAFQSATYLFMMTNYWEHMDKDREMAEGKQMIDCAKKAGVKLLLISSEPSAAKASGGELTKVHHFDSKAEISDYARATGVRFVEIHAGGYMNNFTTFSKPRAVGDGTYLWDGMWAEDCSMPLLDTYHDFGLFVQLAIESKEFNQGDGKVISAYSEWLTVTEQAKVLSEVIGKEVKYNRVTEEQSRHFMTLAGMPSHVIDDMIEMFHFHEKYWASTYVHSRREHLARQPRTLREYSKNEDWSAVFA